MLNQLFSNGRRRLDARRIPLLCVGVMLALAASLFYEGTARAAGGELDTAFHSPIHTQNTLYSVALQPDGKIIINGYFTAYGDTARQRLARLNSDGTLDPTFDPGAGPNDPLSQITLQPDGKILINSGGLTSYNNTPRKNIARLNSDGTLDTSFDPGEGAGPNTYVSKIVLQPDGKIIVMGNFSTYNGIAHRFIARLNSDGSLDNTFDSGTGSFTTFNAAALQPDGKILVGGSFNIFNGKARNHIVRLNSDGSFDATFDPASLSIDEVNHIVVQPDGRIIISYRLYSGFDKTYIARINSDGTLDATFNEGVVTSADKHPTLSKVGLQPDGKVIIVGSFDHYNGTLRDSIARINTDGTLDATFNSGAETFWIFGFDVQPDGKILVIGYSFIFTNTTRRCIARLNSDGTLDATFDPGLGPHAFVNTVVALANNQTMIGGGFVSFGGPDRVYVARLKGEDGNYDNSWDTYGGPTGSVYAVAAQADGKVYIGGLFTRYYTSQYLTAPRNHIARLNIKGQLDTTFNPGAGANDYVGVIALQPDGRIIIGGLFTSYGGTARNHIARLNSGGTLDTTFDPGAGADGVVDAIAVQPDGKILVGGRFTSYNGTARNHIARLNSDGTLDTTFDPGTGASNAVNAIVLQPDGKIIIGGAFVSYNGAVRRRVARLNINGSLDLTFNQGAGANGVVYAVALQRDGKVLVGGGFTSFHNTTRNRIAQLNSDGSLDTDFDPGTGANSVVRSIAIQADGKIVIGGFFTSFNDTDANYVVRLLPTLKSFAFSLTLFHVFEASGPATVTVNRYGDTTEAASVQFSTIDSAGLTNCDVVTVVASARCDYTAVGGTLSFAPGQTSLTFSVPIIDDSYTEGAELLGLVLSNPSAGMFVTLGGATLSITDNDSLPPPNPIDKPEFLVHQHYLDFLNREPEPSGLQAWLDILNNCAPGNTACDEVAVSSGFYRSPEFFERGYFVYRVYETALGRKPDYDEFQTDLRRVSGFLSEAELEARKRQFISDFMQRQAFRHRYDSITDAAGFVDALLQAAGVSLPNRDTLVADLANNRIQRSDVLRAIVDSQEVSARFFNKAFVVIAYFAYLRRNPDILYLEWINKLNNPPAGRTFEDMYREMISGFINSAEYRARFGSG
ncbi:MAG TPA: Calx-beta domain-containing protein [Pyrinomonadaceae bacterium]|nr:Calx-beta domain-containing protein [Pyrinomonadaceae bacterium]